MQLKLFLLVDGICLNTEQELNISVVQLMLFIQFMQSFFIEKVELELVPHLT